MRNAPGFWWSLISAIIGIAAGVALLAQPVTGALSLTFVLIAFFVIEGIVTIMYAIDHRAQLSGRWGLMLASGVVDLVLAGMIFAEPAVVGTLGARPARRHQYGVRRRGHDRHGVRGEGAGCLICVSRMRCSAQRSVAVHR